MFESGRNKFFRKDQGYQESYWDVRWSWLRKHNLDELAARFRLDFDVTKPEKTKPAFEQSILWEELLVKADNLSALLSALRACLFQKQAQSFTQRDRRLKELVYELYPFTHHAFCSPIDLIVDLAIKIKNQLSGTGEPKARDYR